MALLTKARDIQTHADRHARPLKADEWAGRPRTLPVPSPHLTYKSCFERVLHCHILAEEPCGVVLCIARSMLTKLRLADADALLDCPMHDDKGDPASLIVAVPWDKARQWVKSIKGEEYAVWFTRLPR